MFFNETYKILGKIESTKLTPFRRLFNRIRKLLYCKAIDKIARERITAKREAYESDATWAVYQKMKQRFTPPANAIVVDTSGSVDELREKLQKLL